MPSKYATRKRALDEMRRRGISTPLLEDMVGEGPMKLYEREPIKGEPSPVEVTRTVETEVRPQRQVKPPLEEYEIEAEEGPKLKRKVDVSDEDEFRDRSGRMLGFSKGGKVNSASKRADGIAQRGKTKGRYI